MPAPFVKSIKLTYGPIFDLGADFDVALDASGNSDRQYLVVTSTGKHQYLDIKKKLIYMVLEGAVDVSPAGPDVKVWTDKVRSIDTGKLGLKSAQASSAKPVCYYEGALRGEYAFHNKVSVTPKPGAAPEPYDPSKHPYVKGKGRQLVKNVQRGPAGPIPEPIIGNPSAFKAAGSDAAAPGQTLIYQVEIQVDLLTNALSATMEWQKPAGTVGGDKVEENRSR